MVSAEQRVQTLYSGLAVKSGLRWGFAAALTLAYCVRLWATSGFYLLTYCLALYLFTLFIGFITPQEDQETPGSGEFRPFMRAISEMRLWECSSAALLGGTICTYCPFLNLPIYWPLLPVSFLAIAALMLHKQFDHMRKHRYLPWTAHKSVYIDV